jgi:proteic killer suppression protein
VIKRIRITKLAAKQLRKVPPQVQNAFAYWVGLVAEHGLLEVRKVRGFHDEPIAYGPHAGQRSIRTGRGWRAFYVIRDDGSAELIEVIEINKHVYDR